MVRVVGMAVPFNEVAAVRGRIHGVRPVMFTPGAFTRTIAGGRPIAATLNHRAVVLGDDRGDLDLSEGPDGLYFSLTVRNHDSSVLLRHASALGLLRGASVSWADERSHWRGDVCVVTSASLLHVALITGAKSPAFGSTWARLAPLCTSHRAPRIA